MSGEIIRAVPKQSVDFGTLATGATEEIILADRVLAVHWRIQIMLIQVYTHSLAGGAGTIKMGLYPQAVSPDDPGITFIDPDSLQTLTMNSSTPSPAFLRFVFPPPTTPLIRIVAIGTRVAAGQLNATVSAAMSVKDS